MYKRPNPAEQRACDKQAKANLFVASQQAAAEIDVFSRPNDVQAIRPCLQKKCDDAQSATRLGSFVHSLKILAIMLRVLHK
jgi:hypothetical protein